MSAPISSVTAKINIGGTETNIMGFTYNSSTGYWEATATASELSSFLNNDGHFFPVSVTATDAASNSKTVTTADFEELKLFVVERELPTITISGINAGTTTNDARPTISITLTDNNSGISTSGAYVTVDGGSQIPLTLTKTNNNTATGSFTPSSALADGQHTYAVYAKDNDGNVGNTSVTFTVLTAIPSLTVSSPSAETTVTNNATVVVSGKTNNDTGNVIDIKLNDVSQGDITLDSNGNFSKTITLTSDGTYTITITATNAAGLSSEPVTRTIILDTVQPVFTEVVISPNPVDASNQYIIRVKVS